MDAVSQHREAWRYDCGDGAILWQLSFTGSGMLFGQKRFPGDRRSLFFAIDPEAYRVLIDDFQPLDPASGLPLGAGWFTGIESTHRDLVYLHAWQEGSPLHRGIWAVLARTGSILWSQPGLEYVAHTDSGLLACRQSSFAGFPERNYLLLDPLTGKESACDDAAGLRASAIGEDARQEVQLPEATERLPDGSRGGESIVRGRVVAGSVHEDLEGRWRSTLRLWEDGMEVYCDVMDEGGSMPARNNFLIRGDKLYYIKKKRELVAFTLF
ncbi:DUF4905 domain-containing protein [Pelodictyon luteolum]|uniref:DUF4905 domain-containing protein n=1 Tax=Chlorobium luteolum (strain DSM 273 / BCRC 81028 / 2530) TaxID=319225 RepID=Q3B2F2_CHLL3|nr:DUF4905 domain-containing protein [Pelodictyon luteolum]ABB24479.1 conserved hypothetical protein [Pelodictyon luteolum DSM 273]